MVIDLYKSYVSFVLVLTPILFKCSWKKNGNVHRVVTRKEIVPQELFKDKEAPISEPENNQNTCLSERHSNVSSPIHVFFLS